MSAKHVSVSFSFGRWIARGTSSWDMPDGGRLRREMTRSTILATPADVRKWGKRHKIAVEAVALDLAAKQATLQTNDQ